MNIETAQGARAWAVARIPAIKADMAVLQAFIDGGELGDPQQPAKSAAAGTRKRAWSASARKAVSERMKLYWAARRAKTGKKKK